MNRRHRTPYGESHDRRSGFTIIELLVVVTVLGILIALLIPAVQNAREAARRITCSNNLKQLTLAMSSYAGNVHVFPPGGNGNKTFSFISMLLPYIEQGSLYNAINFSCPAFPPSNLINSTAAIVHISTLVCPSDPVTVRNNIAVTNYAGNGGTGFQRAGYDGVFAPGDYLVVGPQNLTDGLSNTAAIAEWRVGAGPNSDQPIFDLPLLDGPQDFALFRRTCASAQIDPKVLQTSNKGNHWILGDYIYTIYNHVLPPGGASCTNGGFSDLGSWTAGSRHAGGAYVAFADGHLEFIKNEVEENVWTAIGSRSSGDLFDKP